jgi:hypothetical protein
VAAALEARARARSCPRRGAARAATRADATPREAELPSKLSLSLDEAKAAIRRAKGDVIQVGFLAGDYKRHQEEDPGSRETAAARAQLCELIATRLRDRKLLAPDGVLELRDGP